LAPKVQQRLPSLIFPFFLFLFSFRFTKSGKQNENSEGFRRNSWEAKRKGEGLASWQAAPERGVEAKKR